MPREPSSEAVYVVGPCILPRHAGVMREPASPPAWWLRLSALWGRLYERRAPVVPRGALLVCASSHGCSCSCSWSSSSCVHPCPVCPWPPVRVRTPMSTMYGSQTAQGPCMRCTWKFPSSPSAENTKTSSQQQPAPLPVTHTRPRYGWHHAWEGTKFPPTTTPASGLHPSVQPVTACATPDSGRSLYNSAHGWSLPSRLSPWSPLACPVPLG